MINMPIYTALIGSTVMVLQMMLMMMVGFTRLRTNITIGQGDNDQLLLAIRRHGNLAENAPIFLLLLGLAEMFVGSNNIILGLGIAFVLVRIAHAVGLTMGGTPNAPRGIGAFGTLVIGISTAGYLSYAVINTM